MSDISKQKALEEYPLPKEESCSTAFINQETFNSAKRTGYEKGYDQAMQDFLDKAEDAISMISRHYVGEDYSFDKIWEQFKNYIQHAEI
jgi:hypothetical protein